MSLPQNPENAVLKPAIALGATAVVVSLTYGLTLAPTVTGEDSGELIAAAYTLGIPHPPGYPLWCLTAHAAIKLVPFGEIAWRVNLVSAAFGVLTACVIAAIVLRLTRSALAAVSGALCYAFAHEVWEQSIIAEVYSQFACLFALTLYFLLRWRENHRSGALYGAAVSAGLGVVAHGLMLLTMPVFAATAIWPRQGQWPTPKQLALSALALTAPFLIFLYLPIRSAANPPMDWGNPESFAAFWDVVTRAQYSNLFTNHSRSLDLFVGQVAFFLRELQLQPLLLAPIGFAFVLVVNRSLSALLFALFVATSLGSILLTNFPLEERDMWLNTAYWIPAYVICAVWSGVLIGMALNRLTVPWKRYTCLAFLLVVGPVMPLIQTYVHKPASPASAEQRAYRSNENRFVYEYAENLLRTLPQDTVYIGGGDHTLFPILYMQIVERRRPDVTILNPYGYIGVHRIDGLAQAFPSEADKVIPAEEAEPAMIAWVASNAGRPVYAADPWKLERFVSKRHGFLYRIAEPGDGLADPYSVWDTYAFEEPVNAKDWTSRLIQFDYFAAAAERDIAKGELNSARTYLDSASTFANWNDHLGGGNKHALNNLAIIAARGGINDYAEEFWLRALEIDPQFEQAQRNLERFRSDRAH